MKNSKLLALLRTFSSTEWKSFKKFLHSPYFNSNKRLLHFYEYLSKYHPGFEHRRLEKPMAFQYLYPEKKEFNDRLLRALMAELHKSAERFLEAEQFKSDERLRAKMLIRSYGERGMYRRFERKTEEVLEGIELQKVKDMGDYYDAFELNREHYFHPGTTVHTTTANSLKKAGWFLDCFFSSAKLRLSCELASREQIVAEKAVYRMLNAVRKFSREQLVHSNPSFAVYLDLLDFINGKDNSDVFERLKNKFLDSLDFFTQRERFEILIYLANKSYHFSKIHGAKFFLIQFELYKTGIEKQIVFENGTLPGLRFTNIAIIASTVQEWDWAWWFMDEYAKYLPSETRIDAVSLSKAFVSFHQKKYAQTYQYLNKVRSGKIIYRQRQSSLELRCLVEMMMEEEGLFDMVLYKLSAFEKFLGRQKVFSEKRQTPDLNYIDFMKKIVRLWRRADTPKKDWKGILSKVESTQSLTAKSWFIDVLKRLEKQGR